MRKLLILKQGFSDFILNKMYLTQSRSETFEQDSNFMNLTVLYRLSFHSSALTS